MKLYLNVYLYKKKVNNSLRNRRLIERRPTQMGLNRSRYRIDIRIRRRRKRTVCALSCLSSRIIRRRVFFQIQNALPKQLEQEIVDLFGVGVLLLEEERE